VSYSNRKQQRWVAIEIRSDRLHVSLPQGAATQQVDPQSISTTWRHDSDSLQTESGRLELAAALRDVVARHRLQGHGAYLTLSGDYCVTRVVTGRPERVRQELEQLEQRSLLYLTLGHGPKALGGSVRHIDSSRHYALLTVVNRRTLDAVLESSARAGLDLKWMEPSLVSVCRLIGHIGGDREKPALVIDASPKGCEVGISHAGRLLLDYRPAGNEPPAESAAIVARHLGRLQRYCFRHAGLTQKELGRIYICGHGESARVMAESMAGHCEIPVSLLSPRNLQEGGAILGDDAAGVEAAASLGAALLASEGHDHAEGPNLMDGLQTRARGSLRRDVVKTLLPLAAALLLLLSSRWFVGRERHDVESLRGKLAQVELAGRESRLLKSRAVRIQAEIDHWKRLAAAIPPVDWRAAKRRVTQCLPPTVWLDRFEVTAEGRLRLSGGSLSDEGVYEFLEHLRQAPGLRRVALEGTRRGRGRSDSGLQFDIQVDLSGHADLVGSVKKEDPADA